MIWGQYVFRRGAEAEELWDQMYLDRKRAGKPVRLLYIAGRGFDLRGNVVISKLVERLSASGCEVSDATLLLVGFSGYQLSTDLHDQTKRNVAEIEKSFGAIGTVKHVQIDGSDGEEDTSTTIALRRGADEALSHISDQTDVILDVSSLPRIAYLTILLSLLAKILPDGNGGDGLQARGVTFQVLVGEDAALDSQISSEDPSNELVLIPGYSEAIEAEALQDMPLIWFPVLGENRLAQAKKVEEIIPSRAEICPILPSPSRNPRRGDELLLEYDSVLFASRETPLTNILYGHEAHPFEVYRQLLGAMQRYRNTMTVLGGCRLVVTPLASKLISIGCALACFEMKLKSADHKSSVAIPYAEPKRYVVTLEALQSSRPEISALILTGDAYALEGGVEYSQGP